MSLRFRRRRVVLQGFQAQWLIHQVLFILCTSLGLAAAVFAPVIAQLWHADDVAAATGFLWLHRRFWPVLCGLIVVLALHAIRTSHRIAGPLYRFRLAFARLTAGDLTVRITVRATDYLQEEAGEFDQAVQSLRQKVATLCHEIEDLTILAETTAPPAAGDMELLRAGIARAAAAARELHVNAPVTARLPMRVEPPRPPAATRASAPTTDLGFSVLELLLVSAVMGTLAAISVPTYMAALDKARTTRAIADLRVIELEIKAFELTNNRLPANLTEVSSVVHLDPWGHEYVYTNLTTINGKGKARKDRFLNPLNSDFDLYSTGPDGQSSTPLTAKASRDDIVRANDGAFIGVAADY
jgi:general secretion pathway protein G